MFRLECNDWIDQENKVFNSLLITRDEITHINNANYY